MRILNICETVWLNREPPHVWALLESLEEWPRWNGALERAAWVDGTGWKSGHRFSLHFQNASYSWLFGGSRVSLVEHLRELRWQARILGMPTEFQIRLAAEGSGTRVTFQAQLTGFAARLASNTIFISRLAGILRSFVESLRAVGECVRGQVE